MSLTKLGPAPANDFTDTGWRASVPRFAKVRIRETGVGDWDGYEAPDGTLLKGTLRAGTEAPAFLAQLATVHAVVANVETVDAARRTAMRAALAKLDAKTATLLEIQDYLAALIRYTAKRV